MMLPLQLYQRLNEATTVEIVNDNARSPAVSQTERKLKRDSSSSSSKSSSSFDRWESDASPSPVPCGVPPACSTSDLPTIKLLDRPKLLPPSPPAVSRKHIRPIKDISCANSMYASIKQRSMVEKPITIKSSTTTSLMGLRKPIRRASVEDLCGLLDSAVKTTPAHRSTLDCLNEALSISQDVVH